MVVKHLSFPLLCAIVSAQIGVFTIDPSKRHQTILGLGFEIQSDSIGSGNKGLPDTNTSVPLDLTPSERARFYKDMLGGFRLCRLALGLYFRGLSADNKTLQDRWPGQSALLAEMAEAAGLEGFALEYWSPAPFWKSNGAYIGGRLRDPTNPSFLSDFASAVAADAQYLAARGVTPSWWGLQNEPAVGCGGGCIYSCCCVPDSNYSLAFKAAAGAIRVAFPNAVIHASSWSGQYWSPSLARDPAALALVDVSQRARARAQHRPYSHVNTHASVRTRRGLSTAWALLATSKYGKPLTF